MKAVDTAPLIQAAYASGRVDDFWGRDWNEAQYELGLKERPATEERSSTPLITSTPARSMMSPTTTPVHKATKKSSASKKGKTKIKMAKASRKANRRKN